jgi:hypothetical protein
MSQAGIHWSQGEKTIAQAALKAAYERETKALIQNIREQATAITLLEEVWQLHDFLSARRYDVDGKYDSNEDSLMFTLSRLVKEGWLRLGELEGLAAEKRAKVKVLTLM